MSKKRILVIITEGETDEEFYKKIIDEIKKVNDNKNFNFSEIKHICSKSITKMHKKMLGKFKNEVCCSKYNDYEKVVCFCYDNDVFEFNQNPPINRPKMKKEFLAAGADKIIEIVAKSTIEDFFLYDTEGVKKYLKLPKTYKVTKKKNGLETLKKMFEDANRVYFKGEKVEGLVKALDKKLILSKICSQIHILCAELGYKCNCDKCKVK